MPYLKIPKGKKTKNKELKPVVGFGNIQFNIKEDVEKAKRVRERDVFDKPKKATIQKDKK
jgi:hypothetical protein